jgi:hypothetical protein
LLIVQVRDQARDLRGTRPGKSGQFLASLG